MPDELAIVVRDLVVEHHTAHGPLRALDCAALTIDHGASVAITGPSGCGKSTLLGVLAGLATPTSGNVWFGATEITAMPERDKTEFRRCTLGVVYQADNLLPFLTIAENVALQLQLSAPAGSRPHGNVNVRVAAALDSLDISETADRFPAELSGGQRQRAAIARAIVHRPKVILADEPTGALDAANAKGVIELLLALQRDLGATLVLVTHDREIAAQLERNIPLRHGAPFNEGEKCDVR